MGLPSATAQSTDVPPVPGQSTGGRSFAWRVPQGFFTVAFADWTYDASDAAKLELSANQTISGAVKAGGKLINKEQKDFAGRPGIESRFNISNHVFIYRHILFKNRLYILSARWPENEDGQRQIEVLDSFKVTGPDTGNG